ncbi:MAG: ABC transporter substrate-binding protein [Finegoldia sp.]|nr:ABC transporter substrate-binding protein [Finegoldia sp.]
MRKLYSLLLVLVLTVSTVVGCAKTESNTTNNDSQKTESSTSNDDTQKAEEKKEEVVSETVYPLTINDQLGNEVTIKQQPDRIVSGYYISSSTCLALGLKDRLVAVEEKIEQRPIYKYSAADIMDSVGNVGSAKAFDLEACIAAKPDLVILPKKAKDYAKTLTEMDIPTVVVNPESHDKLVEMIELIGQATNSNDKATALTDKYDEILNKINDITKDLSDDKKPVVYMCGTSSYLTTAPKDMYQASLITTAGGKMQEMY